MNFLMNSISIGEDAPAWKTITIQSEMLVEMTMVYLPSLAYPVWELKSARQDVRPRMLFRSTEFRSADSCLVYLAVHTFLLSVFS